MTDLATISIRRDHERREGLSLAENLTRDANLILETAGVVRGSSWVRRAVHEFLNARIEGVPFGMYLAAKVDMNAIQRKALADRADLRYLLSYADPTGETAARNVDRERKSR